MKLRLRFTPLAKKDLKGVKADVSKRQSPEAAKRVVSRLMERVRSLDIFPESGTPLLAVIGEKRDLGGKPCYRCLGCMGHVIVYRFDEKFKVVSVIRVIHGRRDIYAALFGEEGDTDD
jgi:plasmid stabilization system protein ParE